MSGPAPSNRKPKRRMSDEERIQIALERFEPLSRGKPLKEINAIATDHDRHPTVIGNAIREAFELKLVAIVQQKHPWPTRVADLEKALLNKFPKLQIARVIRTPLQSVSSTTDRARLADRIHQQLGRIAASLIVQKLLIRDEEVIGMGSGRGVYAVVEALTYVQMLRAHNVTAVSLTGDVYPRSHEFWDYEDSSSPPGRLNLNLDADDHVNLLGLSFPPDLKIVKISSVIAWERGELLAVRKRTILDRDTWKTTVPNLAIVGVGVFSQGHRFFQEAKGPSEKRLAPILGELRELANKVQEAVEPVHAERYTPVADVCNRLFYVKPPPGVSMNGEQEKQIKALIARINDKLLCASEEQLMEIKQLMLVAGTVKKAQAIKQLLEEGKYKIRILCIDQEAAEAILAT